MDPRLTEEDIKHVLARAEELYMGDHDSSNVLRAAEEAGLPREAIEQALRERFELFPAVPQAGELVFAKSSDGRHYVAEVLQASEQVYKVRFLKGGEVAMPAQSLRPCPFLPGEEVTVDWPGWGWWKVKVVEHDTAGRRIKATDGWNEKWFAIADVRLDPPKKPAQLRAERIWAFAGMITGGGLIGAFVTWLLMR